MEGLRNQWARMSPFLNTPHNARILGNTFWLFLDKAIRLAVGLVVGVWVARFLGPEQFGLLNYAVAFVALFSAIATLGLDGIVVREIVRDPTQKDEILGTAFLLKLLGGGLTLLVTAAAIAVLRPGDSLTAWLVAITAVGTIFQAFDVIDFWYQSQVASKYSVIPRNVAFLIVAVFKIYLIIVNAPLLLFAVAGAVEIVLGGIGLLISYRCHANRLRGWRGSWGRARGLVTDSWPLIIGGFSIMVYMKIDQVMLGEMAGNDAVGLYSAATRISEIWYFIPTAIVSSVFPAILEVKNISEELYNRRVQQLFYVMTALALALSIPLTILSPTLIPFLFGEKYVLSSPVLQVHIWASLFVFLGTAQSVWDLAENLTRLFLYRSALGALINIVLNLILIPGLGALGAAIATVISYAFSAYILNAFHTKTRPVFFAQTRSLLFYRLLRPTE